MILADKAYSLSCEAFNVYSNGASKEHHRLACELSDKHFEEIHIQILAMTRLGHFYIDYKFYEESYYLTLSCLDIIIRRLKAYNYNVRVSSREDNLAVRFLLHISW